MSIAAILALAAQIVPNLIQIGTSAKDAWDMVKASVNPDGSINQEELEKLRKAGEDALATINRRAAEAAASHPPL